MAAIQAYESGVTHHFQRYEIVRAAFEDCHPFGAAGSDRLHQATADPELADKWFRDFWEGSRHENRIVGRSRRHAFGTVALDDAYVHDLLCGEVAPRRLSQVRPPLDTRHE